MSNTNFSEINKIKNDDLAFLNSILAYSIYTDREWMIELGDAKSHDVNENIKKIDFDTTIRKAALEIFDNNNMTPSEILKRNYELYLYAYSKEIFEPLSLNGENGTFKSKKFAFETEYSFKNSDYIALDNLARAGYFLTTNEDGSKNLHLTFRGTDNKAKPFMEFVSKAYLDTAAYYDAFKPLEQEIIKYASNPENNIKEIHVSGHSLGGAMVQEFFNSPHVKAARLNCKGFTYGAVGSNKNDLHTFVADVYYTTKKHTFKAFKTLAVNTLIPFVNNFILFSITDVKQFSNVLGISSTIFDEHKDPASLFTNKIVQYEHAADLIPRIGSLLYTDAGKTIKLIDAASKNKKENIMLTGDIDERTNSKISNKFFKLLVKAQEVFVDEPVKFLKNMVSFEYHDMMRYIVNIEHKITNSSISKENKEMYAPYLNDFALYKSRFDKATHNNYADLMSKNLPSKLSYLADVSEQVKAEINKIKCLQMNANIVSDLTKKPFEIKIFHKGEEMSSINSNEAYIKAPQLSDISKKIDFMRYKKDKKDFVRQSILDGPKILKTI